MGMFDNLKVEMDLPDFPNEVREARGGIEEMAFQTKDTEMQGLRLYRITKDKKLQLQEFDVEEYDADPVPEGASTWDAFRYGRRARYVNHRWIDTNETNKIRFYDSYDSKDVKYDLSGWVEYEALVDDGKVVKVKLIEHTKPRNLTSEEIERNNKLKEEAAQRRQESIDNKIQQIEEVKEVIRNLKNSEDYIFNQLIEKLNLHKKEEDLENWIFDYVFNETEHSLKHIKENLSPF